MPSSSIRTHPCGGMEDFLGVILVSSSVNVRCAQPPYRLFIYLFFLLLMFYYICVFIYKIWKVPTTRKKTILVTVHKNELGYHVVHAFLFMFMQRTLIFLFFFLWNLFILTCYTLHLHFIVQQALAFRVINGIFILSLFDCLQFKNSFAVASKNVSWCVKNAQ